MTRSHSQTIGVNEVMQRSRNVEDTIGYGILNMNQIPSYPNNPPIIDGDSTTGKMFDLLVRHVHFFTLYYYLLSKICLILYLFGLVTLL